jgi:hypothetical protein
MEPNFKLILNELAQLNHRFNEQDDRWSRRFADLERGLTERTTVVDARLDTLEASHSTNTDALTWCLSVLEPGARGSVYRHRGDPPRVP